MRILHTADWHLGASSGPASRAREHRWFLDWLLELLAERRVDALLLAGDVFDSMHPSAEAQSLYYRFLAQVGSTGVRDVVVIGGNHDSPSRLDAPRDLLEEVGVHVIGGMPTSVDRDRMVLPLRARDTDEPAAACLAVPYVHEYRLGLRTTDLDPDRSRTAFRDAFAALYSDLADRAERRFPGLPIVATGHLTVGPGVHPDDYPQEIHQVGRIEGLPPDVLDARFRYTALGHIHRSFRIPDAPAWYSGSPVALTLADAEIPRQVLLVDLEGDAPPRVEPILVPAARQIIGLRGSPEQVTDDLAGLSWDTRLPPLVHVRVKTPIAVPGLARRLHEALPDQGDGPAVLIAVQQLADHVSTVPPPIDRPLEDLRPEEVFDLLCDAQSVDPEAREPLQAAFLTVSSADDADLDTLVDPAR